MNHKDRGITDAGRTTGRCLQVSSAWAVLVMAILLLFPLPAHAQDEYGKLLEKKRLEMADREEAVKKEEERLGTLKKELDGKLDTYTKLLGRIEESLKTLDTVKNEKLEYLVKVYESMPAEEAASRLSAMDEPTAVKIIQKMKSKKAGAVMAAIEPRKAAALSESIAKVSKKFPPR